jgi:hypothetical protein
MNLRWKKVGEENNGNCKQLKKRIGRGDDERTSEKEDGVTSLPSLSLSGCNFYDTLYRIFSKRKSWVMDWFN